VLLAILPLHQMGHTVGRLGSTVPLSLAVSGDPSPFLLLSGLLVRSVECLVSVLLNPSCLPVCVFLLSLAGLEAAGYSQTH
jgi:hypothetical protein